MKTLELNPIEQVELELALKSRHTTLEKLKEVSTNKEYTKTLIQSDIILGEIYKRLIQ